MAKRTIQECDLSKEEYDPEETVKITIKKAGKKDGRTYELSAASAEKLEQQLVGSRPLGPDWDFAGRTAPVQGQPQRPTRTLADLEAEEIETETDERFVAQKKHELAEAGVDLGRNEEEPEAPDADLGVSDIFTDPGNGCTHLNKGRIQTTLKNKKRYVYRACRECGKQIPEMTAEGRKAYLTGKPPPDTRIHDYDK